MGWADNPCKIHRLATAVQLPGIPRATAGESWNATACIGRLHVIVSAYSTRSRGVGVALREKDPGLHVNVEPSKHQNGIVEV